MKITWLDKEQLFPTVISKLEQVDVVLDIGCGIMPQRYIRPLVHICCEPFVQYVDHLMDKVKNEYDRNYVVIHANWAEAVKLFPPKSVDTVILVDVIEHLEKEEALRLLKETEKLVRRQLAIFTPIGFLPQSHPDGKDAWGLDGGQWQEHKSGWQPDDFDVNWDVYASKVFHTSDNLGREFETPFGALWAIKNIDSFTEEKVFVQTKGRNKLIHLLLNSSEQINEDAIIFLKKFEEVIIINRHNSIKWKSYTFISKILDILKKVIIQKRKIFKNKI
jgi:predicted SAM-dependent methyltransferase